MTRFRISLSIGVAALGLLLAAAPAQALNLVSYASWATGSNGNPATYRQCPARTSKEPWP